jgi:hypothetical protein
MFGIFMHGAKGAGVARLTAKTATAFVLLAALAAYCGEVSAFPLWPKGKDQTKKQSDADTDDKEQADAAARAKKQRAQQLPANRIKDKGKDGAAAAPPADPAEQSKALPGQQNKASGAGKEQPTGRASTDPAEQPVNADQGRNGADAQPVATDDARDQAKEQAAADEAAIDAVLNKLNAGQTNVPVDFVPAVSGARAAYDSGKAGAHDPMAIYRSCGVSPVEERKIRQLAQDFEGMQRVKLKLLMTLLADLREYELQTDPDPKAVLAKQEEINKVTDAMVVERMKLLLAIRDIMTFEEKQRLVETLQREKR